MGPRPRDIGLTARPRPPRAEDLHQVVRRIRTLKPYPPCRESPARPPSPSTIRKLRSFPRPAWVLVGLRRALASIWRMRSAVTRNCWPILRGCGRVHAMPKPHAEHASSRGSARPATGWWSAQVDWMAASIGGCVCPRLKSPRCCLLSPIGVSEADRLLGRSSAPCAPSPAHGQLLGQLLPAARGPISCSIWRLCGPIFV